MRTRRFLPFAVVLLIAIAAVAVLRHEEPGPVAPLELHPQVAVPFRFVALGDTRFTSSTDPEVANGAVRRAIVRAVAEEKPAFVSFGGDIVYRGDHADDWGVWDSETAAWRDGKIPIYPALGNHDLHGNQKTALSNYFQRFPDLQEHRYYSVRFANCLMLVLDSALGETTGSQGEWLKQTLEKLPGDLAFVIVVLHHPPYTSSGDREMGGGHSSRSSEQALGTLLEEKQRSSRARFVVFAGHVHNYERHEHGGVMYFVTGGGGAHAYPIQRSPSDPFQSTTINYHYLLGEVSQDTMKVTMDRVEIVDGKAVWTQPDSVTIRVPAAGGG